MNLRRHRLIISLEKLPVILPRSSGIPPRELEASPGHECRALEDVALSAPVSIPRCIRPSQKANGLVVGPGLLKPWRSGKSLNDGRRDPAVAVLVVQAILLQIGELPACALAVPSECPVKGLQRAVHQARLIPAARARIPSGEFDARPVPSSKGKEAVIPCHAGPRSLLSLALLHTPQDPDGVR